MRMIIMYADDHPPPHVHVQSPDFNVRIALHTLSPIDALPRGHDLKDVMDYLKTHRRALLIRWAQLNESER
jgi:hypothetical protein